MRQLGPLQIPDNGDLWRQVADLLDPPDWQPANRPPPLKHQVPPAGDWTAWFLEGGRGSGKALGYDTPIPTPLTSDLVTDRGWTTMKEVTVGSRLFDEQGQPCTVTGIFDVLPERAYRLTFSDGTHIDACEDHQWVTLTVLDRKRINRRQKGGLPDDWADKPSTTTAQLAATVTYGKRGDRNHSIPVTRPLDLPETVLPVEPWVLGYWLGNGRADSGVVCCHPDDEAHVRREMQRAGYQCGIDYSRNDDKAPAFTAHGLIGRLRAAGVLGNKHIPPAYLRASERQRRRLLAGLLDSDGYAARAGRVEFCTTTKALNDGIVELARSLGGKPASTEGRSRLYGIDKGPKWRVLWRPTVQPFLSPRKSAQWAPPGAQVLRHQHRMIVSVEPIDPEPMRCVTVDSPNHMYLAGEGMIPTHNSEAISRYLCRWMRTHPGDRARIIAPTLGDAIEATVRGPSGVLTMDPDAVFRPAAPGGAKLYWPNGSEALILGMHSPADVDRLRAGGNRNLDVWEEIAAIPQLGGPGETGGAWEQAQLGLREGNRPHTIGATTPRGNRAWLAIRKLPGVKLTTASLHDNPHTPRAWRERMVAQYGGTRLGRQEIDGKLVTEVAGALWKRNWIEEARVQTAPDLERVIVGIDPATTSTGDHTGIIVAGATRNDNGTWECYVLEDRTLQGTPTQWATTALTAYIDHHATAITVERNQGGDMIATILRNTWKQIQPGTHPPRIIEVHARHGKAIRAEPIAAQYEQGHWHHVGIHAMLEDELCQWEIGGPSPDRLDALVHAAHALTDKPPPAPSSISWPQRTKPQGIGAMWRRR